MLPDDILNQYGWSYSHEEGCSCNGSGVRVFLTPNHYYHEIKLLKHVPAFRVFYKRTMEDYLPIEHLEDTLKTLNNLPSEVQPD